MDTYLVEPAVRGTAIEVPDRLRMAVAAYLARFKGQSRTHAESDLRAYLVWCESHNLAPLAARRAHIELYVRWMQEVRRLRSSTVSRRVSIVASFYRTCVIDGLLEHAPTDHVRRPRVANESPTLGLTHLQFEAILSAARDSSWSTFDFALVAMLGLLGLRIFEATGADLEDLGEEHGHRVLLVRGKGDKHCTRASPPAVARAIERAAHEPNLEDQSCSTDAGTAWTDTAPPAAFATSQKLPEFTTSRIHPHMLRHTYVTTMLDAGVDLRDVQIAARHADPRTTMRYDRARKNLDRHPNYILAATWQPAPELSTDSGM